MNIRTRPFFTALAIACMASACSQPVEPQAPATPATPAAPQAPAEPPPVASSATAELTSTEGNTATGTLTLTAEPGGVHIAGSLTGVAPGGAHGFHVHETGDCSAPDAGSAGGHFNPGSHPHGHPGQGQHHAGDMPNLEADESGTLVVDVQVPGVTLGDGGTTDILGRALVLHAGADDYASQPAGNSGPRIACGVIR